MNNIFVKDNANRIRSLQGARFLFVVLIYMSHCVTDNIVEPFDFGGEIGVSFFFVLSGFVLSLGYGPRVSRGDFSTKKFFWRHFWKLYPLHVLLYAVVLLLDRRIGHAYDWIQMTTSLLLLQSWIPWNHTLYTVNAVSWFLCDTLFFYVVFKSLYGFLMSADGKNLKLGFAAFAVVYLIVASHVPHDMINCTLYANPLLRVVDFALGIIAYRFYKTKCLEANSYTSLSRIPLVVYILLGVVMYFVYQSMNGNGCRCVALFWPFMPLFIVRLVAADGTNDIVARWLASRLMQWLGGISFELFMVHPFAMRLTFHFMQTNISLLQDCVGFSVAFVVAVAMAWLLHSGFVKPIYNVINQRFLRS